jgi:hypothetical protein
MEWDLAQRRAVGAFGRADLPLSPAQHNSQNLLVPLEIMPSSLLSH